MAFNPFHGFRKHQKVFMALLAIVCMFIFVLTGSSTLGWDFFNGIAQVFGMNRAGMAPAATLYGKPVYPPDLGQLRIQREIANRFILQATLSSSESAIQRVQAGLTAVQLEPQTQEQVKNILQTSAFNRQILTNPQWAQYRQSFLGQAAQQYQMHLFTLDRIRQNLMATQKNAEA